MAARKRLVYDEFFLFLLAVRRLKESREDLKSSFIFEKDTESRRLEAAFLMRSQRPRSGLFRRFTRILKAERS